jgi:thiamine biosynthesis protein ThiI
MMKRWCLVDYLFFNLWGSAHELWVKQVSYFLWKNFSVSHKKARFITVNFEDIIKELLIKVNHKFRWILLKRFMLRVANFVVDNNYYAIVKWDSLGQVSSQTLKNMFVIDKASECLVLRPLISSNKQEIVNISKEIWTYDFACSMPEYCWIISDKPSTGASLEDILEAEKDIDDSILKKAFQNRKIEFISEIGENYEKTKQEEIKTVSEIKKHEILIDIRNPEEIKTHPLAPSLLRRGEILEIPFFDINRKFKDLDKTKTYLFYCEKWILSNLHALYLKELWFDNIKIFRKKK